MYKVLVAGRLPDAGLRLMDARDDVEYVVLESPCTEADIAAHIAGADAITLRTQKFDAELIAKANGLKAASRYGVGYDTVEIPALTARGIPLFVVGEANAISVAEHTLAFMLATTRRIVPIDRALRAGDYAARYAPTTTELFGKTVLIVGFGRIGTRVAKRCAAFDMNIVVADPYKPRAEVEAAGCQYVADLREALAEADIVTMHMPGRADGSPEMTAAEFRTMKRGSFFINCARGSLVDEHALAAALRDGHLAGAGLDVTRREPPEADNPLLPLENVVFSPHSSVMTYECTDRMAAACIQNILDWFDGTPRAENVINTEVLS